MNCDCNPACGGTTLQSLIGDNIVFIIIVLAVLYGLGYYVGKAAVRDGIGEALRAPDCPITPPCGL